MNRLTRTAAVVVIALTTLPLARAQEKQGAEIPKLVENIDVRVINVDVVVTDKKGNSITGLTKDDFELYENGMPKPISNFYEVEGRKALNVSVAEANGATPGTATPATAAAPENEPISENLRRRIILYIDNLSLAPFNRNRVFKDMKAFAASVMRPGDETMIATYNRSMKVRLPFSRDPKQVQQTLDIIAGESGLGVTSRSEAKDTQGQIRDAQSYDDAISAARTYSQSVEHDLRQSVASLNALMSTLAGVEGKKILVLTSEGFQMQPGREMFQYIDELSREKQGWNTGGTLLEGMSFNNSSLIEQVARSANANNITMYTIHAGGLVAGNEGMSADNAQAIPFSVQQAALSNSTDSMRLMADMTGGVASLQTNNFAAAFNRIQKDLDSYYSLGYRAGTERVDRQRSIEVRAKNRNYVVRSRQTFVEKSTFAEMSDRVVANLLYKSKANDLKIVIKANTPRLTDNGLYDVPVDIQIPMESLTLLPQGDLNIGGFTVYVAVANKDNDMSDVSQKEHQIRIPSSDMEKIKGKYYTYSLDLMMEPGLNKISIGVSDDISNVTGFARDQIIAQDLR